MHALKETLLPRLIYPVTMGSAVLVYLFLRQRMDPILGAYAALLLAVAAVAVCERFLPYREEWKPDWRERRQDMVFMGLIYLLFSKMLALAAILTISSMLGEERAVAWWPYAWPVFFQGLLMVVIVDFFRYWLHRACHANGYLWRLHAVHHSPKRLHWLNVGRFHPVERALQFLIDSLPFMLIGVGGEVLAVYFLLFAVNGLFQHCNIRLNYGFLNRVVSSAELHRWHHSKRVAESDRNFSNTTILWDMVFGTRFLPPGKSVGELGLKNDRYPPDFLSQMKAPFIAGMERRPAPSLSAREILTNHLLRLKMLYVQVTQGRLFARQMDNPAACQEKLLANILRRNRDTVFGKRYGFAAIADGAGYRERIPVHSYEDLRPFIEEQAATGEAVLTWDQPIMFNQTSGTTGSHKYIPLTRSALARTRRLQGLFSFFQYRFKPEGFQGKLLGLVSPAIEGVLPCGISYGSASGILYRNMPRLTRAKFVLPYEVFEISDYTLKYYLIMRLALAERNVTYLGSANPSTFLKMLEVMAASLPDLLADIRSGTAKGLDRLEPRIAEAIRARLQPAPARSRELEDAALGPSGLDFKTVWPHLKLVTTWTGGSCGVAIAKLKGKLPPEAAIYELGFLASEMRGTLTVNGETGDGVLTVADNYFEFAEKAAWEAGAARFLGVGEVETGRDYYVFVTTASGLYRYAMNDIVRVTGKFRGTPTVRFLQKGKGVTNITGEKLYESQVIEAVGKVAAESGIPAHFFQMLAEESESRYLLYLEADVGGRTQTEVMAARIDAALQSFNLEYHSKRASGRLLPMSLRILRPGASEAYKVHFLAKGIREGQFKPQPLQYKKDFDMDLDAWSSIP